MNFIEELGPLALATRIKDLAELLMKDMAEVYRDQGYDFEPRWFTLFRLVRESEKISVTEIAAALNQTHPAVVQVLNALEKKELIISEKDSSDQRKRLISLSENGKELAAELDPLWRDVQQMSEEILQESAPGLMDMIARMEDALRQKSTYQRMKEKCMERIMRTVDFMPYHKTYASGFRELNENWLMSYLEISDYDRKLLLDPEKWIIGQNGRIVLMVMGERLIGTFVLKGINEDECELSKFTVHEDFRGIKLGRRMLEHAVGMAAQSGYRSMLLFTHHKLVEATRLYISLGFEYLADHPGLKDETGRCSMLMKLEINP